MNTSAHSKATSDLTPPPAPSGWTRPGGSHPLFIVLSGPSGVGKDSVLNYMKDLGLSMTFVVTATSRPPRSHEVHGVDYFFYSRDEFLRMVDAGEFIEYALVYRDYKGIPKSQVREAIASGLDAIVRVDVQGAATIQKLYPQALLIFLTASSDDELIERLSKRKTESPGELELRVQTARNEMQKMELFDYVVENRDGDLPRTVETVLAIITAEHHRVEKREVIV